MSLEWIKPRSEYGLHQEYNNLVQITRIRHPQLPYISFDAIKCRNRTIEYFRRNRNTLYTVGRLIPVSSPFAEHSRKWTVAPLLEQTVYKREVNECESFCRKESQLDCCIEIRSCCIWVGGSHMSHHFAEKSRKRLPSVGVTLVWPTSRPTLAF
jgi:hypothetical protein